MTPDDEARARGSLLGTAVRDLARLHSLAAAVARHGFGELVMRMPLGRRLFRDAPPDGDSELAQGSPSVRFAQLLGSLGPTFTKLGQILSMRKDLLPADWIAALETLQDRAPELPFATIRAVVESGLGAPLADLYAQFDERPLATASIAQTHVATTLGGERVVVKVQRPGIETTMRSDLDLLFLAAQALEASVDEMQLLGISGVVAEFEKGVLRELDFREELANLLQARQLLDPERKLTVPRPHPELSCKTVLTMQLFPGTSLRTLAPGSDAAKAAIEEVVHAACKQVLLDGFFHGDPHAGNLLVDAAGTVCLIDLGLMGRLTEDQRDDLVTLIFATITNDTATLARILLRMGTPTQRVNLAALRTEIQRIRERYFAASSLADVDSSAFAQELAETAQRFRIQLASEHAILTKAATTIEGLVRSLHPHVDLVAIARPYVQQALARRLSPLTLAKGVAGDASGLASMLRGLPAQLDQVLHDVESGSLQLRALTPELDAIPGLLHQLAGRLGLTGLAASLSVCAAIVLPPDDAHWLRWLLFAALVAAAACSWTVLFWWHLIGRGKPLRLTPLLKLFRR